MMFVSRIAAAAVAQEAEGSRSTGGPTLGRERNAVAPEPPEPPLIKVPSGVYAAALEAAASAPEAGASPTLPELACAAVAAAAAYVPAKKPSSIYYHRELLCRSLEGRRVDLLTISGVNGMLAEVEKPIGGRGVLPEGGERPRLFKEKKVFLLTARVHPGETPASHVLDGFLHFLLREDDPRARALREKFVFKLVPIINPDGVYRGHYRGDTRATNLNRFYGASASAEHHPSVYAIGALVRQLHQRGNLQFYVDTHAHATKKGCFLYGNALQNDSFERMVDNVMYAKLVAANCRWFDFGGCVFSERNMYRKDSRDGLSKEGSGRVAVFKMTNATYVYTLECNYNMGKVVNRLQPPHAPKGVDKNAVSPPPPPLRTLSPKYTPDCWRSVGKALALAALDVTGANPCSRLGAPGAGGYARLRGSVTAWVKTFEKREAKRAPVRRGGGDSDDDDGEEDGEENGEEEEEEEEEGGDDDEADTEGEGEDGAEFVTAIMRTDGNGAGPTQPRGRGLLPTSSRQPRASAQTSSQADEVRAALLREEPAAIQLAHELLMGGDEDDDDDEEEELVPHLARVRLAEEEAAASAAARLLVGGAAGRHDDDDDDAAVHDAARHLDEATNHSFFEVAEGQRLVRHVGGHRMSLAPQPSLAPPQPRPPLHQAPHHAAIDHERHMQQQLAPPMRVLPQQMYDPFDDTRLPVEGQPRDSRMYATAKPVVGGGIPPRQARPRNAGGFQRAVP